MEKIQVSLPSPILNEMAAMMKEAGFDTESEFGRHIITEWITLRKYGVIKAPGGILRGMDTIPQGVGGVGQSSY